jgi:hypothetical protein
VQLRAKHPATFAGRLMRDAIVAACECYWINVCFAAFNTILFERRGVRAERDRAGGVFAVR